MKFFADENVARPTIQWLRQVGHDVLSAAEAGPGRTMLSGSVKLSSQNA